MAHHQGVGQVSKLVCLDKQAAERTITQGTDQKHIVYKLLYDREIGYIIIRV